MANNELILIVLTAGSLMLGLFSFLLKLLNDINKELKEINEKIISRDMIKMMILANIHQHQEECRNRRIGDYDGVERRKKA